MSTAGVDAKSPFVLRVLDANGRILLSVKNVFASDIRVSGKGKGGIGIGKHFSSDTYHITDIVELREGRIRSQFGDLDRKIQAAASDALPLEPQVVEPITASHTVFSGTLLEYLNRFQDYQIKPTQLIGWQAKVNEWHRSKNPAWLIVRHGIRNWKVCADVYDAHDLGAKVLTTDNEATVSFYEHCRSIPAPESFDLFASLKDGVIRSGTIKYCDNSDKPKIRQRLLQYGLQERSRAPRPYAHLKYSHIAAAKAGFSQSIATSPAANLIASATRCISPCNVLLTHTPQNGNFSVKHFHLLNENSVHDFGEQANLLKYFLAWTGVAAAKAGGAPVFHEFCRLADVFHAVGLDDFSTHDGIGLVESLEKILREATTVRLSIALAGG
jgi:hypothetical protein